MSESKRKMVEEEKKKKEDEQMKKIEMKQAKVKKLQETFELDKELSLIDETYKKKDWEAMIEFSSKCQMLFVLMKELVRTEHKLLIFSMSKKMLNLIEEILKSASYSSTMTYRRIDGDTEISSRDSICQEFNSDHSIFCCLLTTKVGGFGLNLTGADRVVILDPDWNPANDNQAIDRICRIG